MRREFHVRFCEGGGVRAPSATRQVYENLIRYIEQNQIRPLVSKIYQLSDIKQAQQDFLEKGFVGKLVLTPPQE